jgi:predicted ATP-grasp superfamily ATP-dependent carboligase
MFTPSKVEGAQPVSFTGSRLILPCVSVGNVAQLAVDLFINSLQLARVGHLHHASLLPLVGSSAFSHTTHCLHTAAEVYHSSELKVTVVQIRTPIAKGCGEAFCDALLQWIRTSQFTETVLLTSTHAHERRDSQIEGYNELHVWIPLIRV